MSGGWPPHSARERMMRARIEPAEQDADDIGERVPADRERADLTSTGSKAGKGMTEASGIPRPGDAAALRAPMLARPRLAAGLTAPSIVWRQGTGGRSA